MTGARTRIAGVTGRPVDHSLSPVIHNAWIEALGLDAAYAAFPAEDEATLRGLAQAVRGGALAGLNVTAPWKAEAFSAADSHDPTAAATGSANLLTPREGLLHAASTDGLGVLAALAEQAPDVSLEGAEVLILGAGGATAAILPALLGAGVRHIRLLNRTLERATTLADGYDERISAALDGDLLDATDLVVNAVAGEAPPFDFGRTPAIRAALDMTYRPLRTAFLDAAEASGAAPVDGLAMLIGQARPSFQAIFDTPAPDSADLDIRAVAIAELERSW